MNLRLKLTQRNYVGYTGVIGRYRFVDGISVEEIPFNERVRIGANFSVVEIDADGNELGNPSPAHSVMLNHRTPAIPAALERQSEEEKARENASAVLGSHDRKIIYSQKCLEAVVEDAGIAGLRKIASVWGVRSKSIPVLMQMIMDAQNSYAVDLTASMKKRGISDEEIALLLAPVDELVSEETVVASAGPVVEEKTVEEPVADEAVTNAAVTGDLAAAISAVETWRSE